MPVATQTEPFRHVRRSATCCCMGFSRSPTTAYTMTCFTDEEAACAREVACLRDTAGAWQVWDLNWGLGDARAHGPSLYHVLTARR